MEIHKTTLDFTLKDTLSELGVTMNALAVEAKIRPATVADIVNGRSKSINFETLLAVVNALNRFSDNKQYGIENVFKLKISDAK